MNRAILNIEFLEARDRGYTSGSSHTSLKNKQVYFSVPPCGTQGSFLLNISKLWKRPSNIAKAYLSLERDRNWLATIQREGSAGLGVTVLFQTQWTITNLKS